MHKLYRYSIDYILYVNSETAYCILSYGSNDLNKLFVNKLWSVKYVTSYLAI